MLLALLIGLSPLPPPPAAIPPPAIPSVMQGPMIRAGQTAVPQRGITVRGTANLTAQASTATLDLGIVPKQRGQMLSPADLTPVIDALVQAGVSRDQVQLPVFFTAPQMKSNRVDLKATVAHPTVAMIENGIGILAPVFANSGSLWLSDASVQVRSDDCAAVQRQAEDAAVKDARAQAQHLAQQLGVKLGTVLSADYLNAGGYGGESCMAQYPLGPYYGNNGPSTLADFLSIRVFANVTMRFAIK